MEFNEIMVKECPGVCRCCLSEGCYKDLGTEYTWMNDTEVYAEMLLDCFDISISKHSDGPNGSNRLICEVCITRLRDACNFKKQVLDSEKKFIDMVARGEFQPKMVIYEAPVKSENISMIGVEGEEEPMQEAEVEFLEDDLDYDEVEQMKEEPSGSSIVVPPLIKSKRGRPKKSDKPEKKSKLVKTEEKAKSSKVVAKGDLADESSKQRQAERRKEQQATLLLVIIQNSTILPFRWHWNQYKCFYCPSKFVESTKLREHTKEHTEVRLKDVIPRTLQGGRIKLDISQLGCTKCESEFNSFKEYFDHLAPEHEVNIDEGTAQSFLCFCLNDELMDCLICGQQFRYFGTILAHTHKDHVQEKYICEICGTGFADKINVQGHIRLIHNVKFCKHCNKTFKTSYAKQKHVENEHKTDRVRCDICNEILGNSYLKTRHMALVHNCESMQIVCEICSKVFTRKSKYMQHKMRIHYKEKNSSCEVCGFKTFDTDSLKKHMLIHDLNRSLFICGFCHKTYKDKKCYMEHLKAHTHYIDEAAVICEVVNDFDLNEM